MKKCSRKSTKCLKSPSIEARLAKSRQGGTPRSGAVYRDNAGYRIAVDFRDTALRTAEQLREHPEIGLCIHHNARRILVENYP